jgi:fumarate hydratase class II
MNETRTERDSLGPVEVPAAAYYGAQTRRAYDNFPVSGLRMPRGLIRAMGIVKRCCAVVNAQLGEIDQRIAQAIVAAADEVIAGQHDADFIVDIFQTGSGTSTNMNANEVISNRAIEILGGVRGSKQPVHPNDHVNASQSSNDTFPAAIHIAAFEALQHELKPALAHLRDALAAKEAEFSEVVKCGRTHLQDAVPVTLGQEVSGWRSQIEHSVQRLEQAAAGLAELALGGTAVGTGINTPPRWAEAVNQEIARFTSLPFRRADNFFEALAARDAAVYTSGACKTIACALTKIANDIRWLASGPRCGIGELILPSLQPGSSIMPGKVNPVVPESVLMVCAQVVGNDAAITVGGLSGNFELNVMKPVIAYNLLQQLTLLANAARMLADTCVAGLLADAARCRELVDKSFALVTALNTRIGYDLAAEIAKESVATGRSVGEIARERRVLPADELDRLLDPLPMTRQSS